MAIALNDNIKVNAPKPSEERYLNNIFTYTSTTQVDTATVGRRYTGLTVNINGEEWWYKNTIADGGLIIKNTNLANGITGNGTTNILAKFASVTGLTNSNITDNGSLITLGSNTNISGDTIINGNTNISGNTNILGIITANTFIKSGGTSNQFLMADGSTRPVTPLGIVGSGTTNQLPKFSSVTGLSNSNFSDNGSSGFYSSGSFVVTFNPGGNQIFRTARNQANTYWDMGNPDISQPFEMISSNYFGAHFKSGGFLTLGAGSAYTEGLRVLSGGLLRFTQTPTAGTATDMVLSRDISSGNINQIPQSAFSQWITSSTNIYNANAGQVLVNTTSAGSGPVKLYVNGGLRIGYEGIFAGDGYWQIDRENAGNSGAMRFIGFLHNSGGNNRSAFKFIDQQGAFYFNIRTDGHITSSEIFDVLLPTPTGLTISFINSGGTLTAGLKTYRVSGVDDAGETLGSANANITTTGTSSIVTFSWSATPGVKYYKIYKGAVFYTANTNTFIDNGSIGTGTTGAVASLNTTASVQLGVDGTGKFSGLVNYNSDLSSFYTDRTHIDKGYLDFRLGGTGFTSYWTSSTGTDAVITVNSGNIASGNTSLAEGANNIAGGDYSHVEGFQNIVYGRSSHAEGEGTIARGDYGSHAEGNITESNGIASHAEGQLSFANGNFSHAEGTNTQANAEATHAEGWGTTASGLYSHSEGQLTQSIGESSHTEGKQTTANGNYSHSEGIQTTSFGTASHAEGTNTLAQGNYSHSEGQNTTANGDMSHAEGNGTFANNAYAHAEGILSQANGLASHAEGNNTQANGLTSHSEGTNTIADGDYSHAGGNNSQALGTTSFVHGDNSVANNTNVNVLGGNITGNTADTTYVDKFNIKTVAVGTTINTLGIDANGNVISSSTPVILGSGTTNVIPKFNSISGLTNSNLSDNGVVVSASTDMRINDLTVGRGGGNQLRNTVLGLSALTENTTGNDNVAIGHRTIFFGTTPSNNVAIGSNALIICSGIKNIGIGSNALTNNGGNFNNLGIGHNSLLENINGSNNISFSEDSGRYLTNKSSVLTAISNSIFIGYRTSPLANSDINEIIIGYDANGLGSNSVVLGNDSVVKTALKGRVVIGTTGDTGERLQVSGSSRFVNSVSTATTVLISSNTQSSLVVVGSGNSTTLPIFSVQGSQGELFSVTDSLTGSLFSVNDISGLPVLEAFSDATILMGNFQAPSLNTTVKTFTNIAGVTNIYSIPISAYTGAFIEYTVNNGANLRAGSFMSVFNTATTQYSETSTNDIGNTGGIILSMIISGASAIYRASGTTSGWTVKSIIRTI